MGEYLIKISFLDLAVVIRLLTNKKELKKNNKRRVGRVVYCDGLENRRR